MVQGEVALTGAAAVSTGGYASRERISDQQEYGRGLLVVSHQPSGACLSCDAGTTYCGSRVASSSKSRGGNFPWVFGRTSYVARAVSASYCWPAWRSGRPKEPMLQLSDVRRSQQSLPPRRMRRSLQSRALNVPRNAGQSTSGERSILAVGVVNALFAARLRQHSRGSRSRAHAHRHEVACAKGQALHANARGPRRMLAVCASTVTANDN